ncbi:MAG: peptidylprolyl isomerase [Oscillospiraceae bacterium]|nr:peptidylprolyl isomerase [Oscillospiraceae bacterium]
MKKKLLICMTLALAMLTGCSSPASTNTTAGDAEAAPAEAVADNNAEAVPEEANDNSVSADASVSDENIIVITLYPDIAPITCENFENLVSEGFYNGLTFHRVVDDFMAQGGDPQGTGMGGSENKIKGEFSSNGVENTLSHKRGIVSMARSSDPDSASSQFFICYTDCSFLDGNYAAFGEVTQGMEVVDNFLNVTRSLGSDGAVSAPNTPITMQEVKMLDPDENGNPRVQITMADFLTK